jgi:hypothetical protein
MTSKDLVGFVKTSQIVRDSVRLEALEFQVVLRKPRKKIPGAHLG